MKLFEEYMFELDKRKFLLEQIPRTTGGIKPIKAMPQIRTGIPPTLTAKPFAPNSGMGLNKKSPIGLPKTGFKPKTTPIPTVNTTQTTAPTVTPNIMNPAKSRITSNTQKLITNKTNTYRNLANRKLVGNV